MSVCYDHNYRANSELLSHPKPDVTLVTPHQQAKSSLAPGKSVGDLANHDDFDENTFVVKERSSAVLPTWAKEVGNYVAVRLSL